MVVSAVFDPYHKWLGIPPAEQPPDHYRLLGIDRFETDCEVIESGADQRMDFLRTFQNGPHCEQSQGLLNQVAAAKLCLLKPERKAVYDNGLRLRAGARIPPSVRISQKTPFYPRPMTLLSAPSPFVESSRNIEVLPAPVAPAALDTNEPPDAVELEELGITASSGTHLQRRPKLPSLLWRAGPWLISPLVALAIIALNDLRKNVETTSPTVAKQNAVRSDKPFANERRQQTASAKGRSRDSSPAVRQQLTERPAGPRLPVPSDQEQQEALREIRDVMREEFAEARDAGGQQVLAHKLEQLAVETENDQAIRFTLLWQAIEAAVVDCDGEFAMNVGDRLTSLYEMDVWKLRSTISARLSQTATTEERRTALVKQTMRLVAEATNDDRYDVAVALAELATTLSAMLENQAIRDQAGTCAGNVKRIRIAAQSKNAAIDRFLMDPNDPEANLVIGKFRCFDKQDWQTGLPFLAHGGDAELQELARQELKRPSSTLEVMTLANAWWDLAERTRDLQDDLASQPFRSRAIHWYRQALPKLSGLALLKAQKRIAEQNMAR